MSEEYQIEFKIEIDLTPEGERLVSYLKEYLTSQTWKRQITSYFAEQDMGNQVSLDDVRVRDGSVIVILSGLIFVHEASQALKWLYNVYQHFIEDAVDNAKISTGTTTPTHVKPITSPPPPPPPPPNDNSNWIYLTAIAALLVVVACLAGILIGGVGRNGQSNTVADNTEQVSTNIVEGTVVEEITSVPATETPRDLPTDIPTSTDAPTFTPTPTNMPTSTNTAVPSATLTPIPSPTILDMSNRVTALTVYGRMYDSEGWCATWNEMRNDGLVEGTCPTNITQVARETVPTDTGDEDLVTAVQMSISSDIKVNWPSCIIFGPNTTEYQGGSVEIFPDNPDVYIGSNLTIYSGSFFTLWFRCDNGSWFP